MVLLPHFTRSLLLRASLIWVVLRAAVELLSRVMAATLHLPSQPFLLTPRAALALVAFTTAVGWVEVRRRNEDLFLLCLGYGRLRLLVTLSIPAVLMELGIGILVRR